LGQKTHPVGTRLGIIRTWESRWFATKQGYADQLHEDIMLKKLVKAKLSHAGISKMEVERRGPDIRLIIHTARPGIIIGKKGVEVDKLRKLLESLTTRKVNIDIKEIRKPELDAQLVAENVAMQIKKRVAFRSAMKKAISSTMRFGALGVRINSAGRLAGAEIARTEWYRDGRVPLHTFRADIEYGFAEAKTTYGIIGIKVWIYKGDILPEHSAASVAGA